MSIPTAKNAPDPISPISGLFQEKKGRQHLAVTATHQKAPNRGSCFIRGASAQKPREMLGHGLCHVHLCKCPDVHDHSAAVTSFM
jgi:hypothetical protein